METIESTNKNYWMKIRHPYSCGIEITPYCNMHCVHCYLQDYKTNKYLDGDEIKKILDILFEKGVLFVYFTGGEIFTHPDFLEVYLYAKKRGFIVELLSNATLLDEKILDIFSRYPPATISISIYGANEDTYQRVTRSNGNYVRAMNALQMLYKAGIHFDIKFIALKQNLQDFYKVADIAQYYGAGFTHTFEMFPTLNKSCAPVDCMVPFDEIIAFEKNYPTTAERWAVQSVPAKAIPQAPLFFCDIARSSFVIDCEGYANPCNKLRPRKYKMLEMPFDEIWEAFAAYKKMSAPADYLCPTCPKRTICMPCTAENLLTNDTWHIPPENTCILAGKRMNEFSNSCYDCYRN